KCRVSNVNCKDDRDGCIREVVIKFVDQDHDGPFDLFFQTGRMSLARDSSTFLQMLNLKNEDDMEKWCLKNPYVYRALVDSIRRGPSSFADLTYYSQLCYRVTMPNKKKQLVKFRLIPVHAAAKYDEVLESGMLTVEEQNAPWLVLAADEDERNDNYLRQEFKTRLWRDEPVTFYMDVQMGPQSRDFDHVNPQLLWNEDEFPWSRLMRIELTTHVASEALRRTTFNMADNPAGIGFPTARSPQDPFSLQKVMISTFTEMERKVVLKEKTEGALNTTYIITIFSESLKESRPIPFVEVYVTLIGWLFSEVNINQPANNQPLPTGKRCRSSPLVLSRENREGNWEKSWFLRSLTVEDVKQNKSWTFPCYEVVENPILLLPGEAYLAHNELYQVSKKERLFQLNERKCEYLWDKKDDKKLSSSSSTSSGVMLPGQIRNPQQVNKLPERHKSRAAKYTGVRWEVDPKLIDFFREFRFRLASKLPDGSPGDMCHAVLKDEDFANLFLVGSNPVLIQKCTKLPNKFPVTNIMVRQFLDGYNLQQAIEDGRIFIVDYKILNKITTTHHNTDHRFIASPIVLFYLNDVETLLPLAIQLNQEPASDSNPIWTPNDKEGWLLAKLWVRCSDFNYQFAVSHLFNCHFLMEPFLIATMRCLPSSHPCYKILLPHFRYLLVSNTLIRHQLLSENGAVDKYTSLGRLGFQELMERHWSQFHFDHLNPRKDFERREVSVASHLPGYIYRDDALRLFDCINNCCDKLLNIHYGTPEDFLKDEELASWFDELSNFGFPGHFFPNDSSLNKKPSNLKELGELLSSIIFTITCQHSATHSDALDLFGYVPDVPAMMKAPPITKEFKNIDSQYLAHVLPEQFPEAYYTSLLFIMNAHKPDEVYLINIINLLG
ncbi:hypothetical protein HELRODRAFT_66358, partial [Helobdella robusta]|uniref:Lipoxygenase domain-containing protein n=1 Tax=Helobdella robusta TaxID=6412 RepID=T1FYK1_HELRO